MRTTKLGTTQSMNYDFSSLIVISEVNAAFLAFAVIVASIRVTSGEKLDAFQLLLVEFFAWTGMIAITIGLLPTVLWHFWPDEHKVASIVSWYSLAMLMGYLPYYLRRRARTKATFSLMTAFTILGWFIWLLVLLMISLGYVWQPTLGIISAYTLWCLFSSMMIFYSFLASFLGVKRVIEEDELDARRGK